MKYQLALPIAILKAAYLATILDKKYQKDYPQPSFEHVFIKDGYIIGTNGHMMFYAKLENVPEDARINIPVKSVKYFLKKIKKFNLHMNSLCILEYDSERATGVLEIPNYSGAYECFKVFLNKYNFNWKKPIPENKSYQITDLPQFQGAYIKRAEKIASIFGSICTPSIKPTGEKAPAIIEFLHQESDFDINLILMPCGVETNNDKYCVVIYDEPHDAEPTHIHPAESAEIAVRAVKRLRADMSSMFDDINFSPENCIEVRRWVGPIEEHEKEMFYTEEWFKKPLKRYDDKEKALAYMAALNDCVQCYVGELSITAYTPEEVIIFFDTNTENAKLIN